MNSDYDVKRIYIGKEYDFMLKEEYVKVLRKKVFLCVEKDDFYVSRKMISMC